MNKHMFLGDALGIQPELLILITISYPLNIIAYIQKCVLASTAAIGKAVFIVTRGVCPFSERPLVFRTASLPYISLILTESTYLCLRVVIPSRTPCICVKKRSKIVACCPISVLRF